MTFFGQVETFRISVLESARFVYANSYKLVPISIAWFLASLPIITIGIATIGAYAAIISLRRDGEINMNVVRHAVRTKYVPGVLFGLLPGFLTLIWMANVASYVQTGRATSLLIAIGVLYFLVYTSLVLISMFIEFVDGTRTWPAFKRGNVWVRKNSIVTILIAATTIIIFVVSILLTIMFVLLFPALAFSLHIIVYESTRASSHEVRI